MNTHKGHIVSVFFEHLWHITLMFCVAFFLIFIPNIASYALVNTKMNEILNNTLVFIIIFILYTQVYKKGTLKIPLGWLTFFMMLSFISVIWYHIFAWKVVVYFTGDGNLAAYSKYVCQIFFLFPLLTYITAFKSKRWFEILVKLTIALTAITIAIVYFSWS